MTSSSNIKHVDLDLIRSSLAEIELQCALLRDTEQTQRQGKKKTKDTGTILDIMNRSNKLIKDPFNEDLYEKSDSCKTSNEELRTFPKNIRYKLPNDQKSKNDYKANDISKPFVPPKQVLMYLVR